MPKEYQTIAPNILPAPYRVQLEAIRVDELAQNPKALEFAYDLDCFTDRTPREDLSAPALKPYYEIPFPDEKSGFIQYTNDPESPNLGLISTPIDRATDLDGKPVRLVLNKNGDHEFYVMGSDEVTMAIATRAYWFNVMHSPEMYRHLKALASGEIPQVLRSNTRSEVIEQVLQIYKKMRIPNDANEEELEVLSTEVIQRIGYARQSANENMSRTKSANMGLFLMSTGIPSSVYALGGMPPTTGWNDVLVTSALQFQRAWITRNSLFVDPERQIRMFRNVKNRIEKLELDEFITDISVRQIGMCVGTENPQEIAKFAKRIYEEGCRAIRIYTTNPDPRTIEAAKAIRQAVGKDMVICVAPIVDKEQADKLVKDRDTAVNILLAGHGGGENCTSLAAGGAANALELAYLMSLDPLFNKVAIGFEGGTGPAIGGILGMIDVISMNRRGVGGGIETGGLFVRHKNGRVVQPYHGSASPITQWIEALADPEIALRRLNAAGRLTNVEGKPGYMQKDRAVTSIVDLSAEARMYAGRALADQRSHSIYELRENIGRYGYNHRLVTTDALAIANPHGANSR